MYFDYTSKETFFLLFVLAQDRHRTKPQGNWCRVVSYNCKRTRGQQGVGVDKLCGTWKYKICPSSKPLECILITLVKLFFAFDSDTLTQDRHHTKPQGNWYRVVSYNCKRTRGQQGVEKVCGMSDDMS